MKKSNCGHPVAFLRTGNPCKQAYLLAGGESRRMGQDKLFLPIGGRTLLDRVYTVLTKRFDSVKIAARSQAKFAGSSLEVVIDSPRAKGPMAGLIALLEDCPDQACFVCAVDLPDISTELIDRLLRAYQGEDYLGVYESRPWDDSPSEGGQPDQAIQPLCGIWSTNALPTLYRLADEDNYRLNDLLRVVRSAGVAPPSSKWRNLNYPADLDQSGAVHG